MVQGGKTPALTGDPALTLQIFVPGVADEWKNGAMDRRDVEITPNMAQWMIEELQFKAIVYEKTQTLSLYNGDITKSDIGVPEDLRQRVADGVKPLERVPPELQFFNPGSENKQRDLVPIGLFPLVYGRSRILKDKLIGIEDAIACAGRGEVIPCPEETGITREDIAWRVASRNDIAIRPYSRNFQLLPCDLKLVDGKWKIASYINNLHPKHYHHLYEIIEELFNYMVPQWNGTLTPLKDMLHSRARIEYKKAEYYPLSKEMEQKMPKRQPREAENLYDERLEEWRMNHLTAVQPDAKKFIPWAVPQWMMPNLPPDLPTPVRIEQDVSLNRDYGERGLQLIVRILSAELRPEDSSFSTDWHVEGQLVRLSLIVPRNKLTRQNEHIVASAFYTFETDNVQDIVMEFRQIVETDSLEEVEHEPNDSVWLKQVYGFEVGDAPLQTSGGITCRVGRTVMFPSTIQHRLTGYKLKDPTRRGFSKSVAMFLVDPNIRIISTANVPPQRLDWTFEQDDIDGMEGALDRLSVEFEDRKGDLPLSMSEAKKLHTEILKELIEFTKYQHVAFASKTVSL